jgi:hypothetical protein
MTATTICIRPLLAEDRPYIRAEDHNKFIAYQSQMNKAQRYHKISFGFGVVALIGVIAAGILLNVPLVVAFAEYANPTLLAAGSLALISLITHIAGILLGPGKPVPVYVTEIVMDEKLKEENERLNDANRRLVADSIVKPPVEVTVEVSTVVDESDGFSTARTRSGKPKV